MEHPTYKDPLTGRDRLAIYAWPGGYPVFYYVDATCLCRDCAEEELEDEGLDGHGINWENPNLFCDGCGERIESAYAEEEEEEEEEASVPGHVESATRTTRISA